MSRQNTRKKPFRIALCAAGVAFALGASPAAHAVRIQVVYDDITNSFAGLCLEDHDTQFPSQDGSDGTGSSGSSSDGSDGSSSSDNGKDNNGHGNNEDGVDVSNKGKGKGGPTGSEDPSGTVDDESKGGGASPSKK